MANSDIRKFKFWNEYDWQATDFDDFYAWLTDMVFGLFEGHTGSACLSGLAVTPNGGMQVSIAAGLGVGTSKRLFVVAAPELATFSTPIGNPARSLVVLRPLDTDVTDIVKPTDPEVTVQLHTKLGYQVVVITGTPAATPVYPATVAGDVILTGVLLAAGQTVIAQSDLDFGARDVARKVPNRIRVVKVDYTIDVNDEIVEVDATAGNIVITAPNVVTAAGRRYTIVRVDNSANSVTLSGGVFSGQATVPLEDQWDKLVAYSNSNAWRLIG